MNDDDAIDRSEVILAVRDNSSEARTGLGGLVSKAAEVVGGAASIASDVATAPVQALVDLAQLVVDAVQAAVDAAQDVLTSVDQSRC